MPITFLFQHDALCDEEMVNIIGTAPYIETGVWLELNRSLAEEAGVEWKAEEDWCWYSNVDLMSGYEPEKRKRIVDIVMDKYKCVFGDYPKTVGAWLIDAVTLSYLKEKYNISASLNCKDQWGTDGYSLWGGYYNQAFYPCVNNAFCPAQTEEEQINVPIFRMLGSDPISQYNCESDDNGQNVISLEPVYADGGGNREWVEWFFRQITENDAFSFGYAQAGQENSFGWKAMEKGYVLQMEIIDRLRREGKIEVMKVCDAGEWYKSEYKITPVSVVQAERDAEKAIWYSCCRYRAGFYSNDKKTYIRDIMMFDEKYCERYLKDTCKSKDIYYDNLPVVDSYRWSDDNKVLSGLFFEKDGERLEGLCGVRTYRSGDCLVVEDENSDLKIEFCENSITIRGGYTLVWELGVDKETQISFKENSLELCYCDFNYEVTTEGETISEKAMIKPVEGIVRIIFCEN